MFLNEKPTSDQDKKNKRRLFLFVLLSLILVHLPASITIYRIFSESLTTERPVIKRKDNPVMVDLNSQFPKRIADIPKPEHEEIPSNPTAVGKYNSTVKEETVSINPKIATSSQRPEKTTTPQKTSTQEKSNKEKSPQEQTQKIEAPKPVPEPSLSETLLQLKNKRKEETEHKKLFGKQNETAFKESLPPSSPSGGGDFFPDYKVGGKTYLNILARPNIFYFVELKRKFRAAFNPVPALQPLIGKLPKGRISVVWGFSIDKNGKMSTPILLSSSGIPAYDNEGKRVITVSQPFTNPPIELLDPSGIVYLAWTFIVMN